MSAKIATANDMQQLKNIVRAIKTEKLKAAALCRLAGLSDDALKDTLRGKSVLSYENFLSVKKAINIIRNDVKAVLQEIGQRKIMQERTIEQIKQLFQREEVAWFVVLERNREQRNKFDGWLNGRRSFPTESIDFLKSCLLILVTETTI